MFISSVAIPFHFHFIFFHFSLFYFVDFTEQGKNGRCLINILSFANRDVFISLLLYLRFIFVLIIYRPEQLKVHPTRHISRAPPMLMS